MLLFFFLIFTRDKRTRNYNYMNARNVDSEKLKFFYIYKNFVDFFRVEFKNAKVYNVKEREIT